MSTMLDGSASSSSDSDGKITVPTSYRPFYCLFAAIGVVLFYYAMGYAKKYSTMAAFLLPVRPSARSCWISDLAMTLEAHD